MIEDLAKLISEARKQHTPSELKQRFVNRDFDDTFYLIGIGINPFLKNAEPHEAVFIGYLITIGSPLAWQLLAL